MLIVIHNYSSASLDKQIQPASCFQTAPCCSPYRGWWWQVLLLPSGWLKVQRGKLKDRKQRRNRELHGFFFHAAILAFMHMRLFAGKKGHSLNVSVNKHPLVGMFPNSKLQWTWTQSHRTVWDSEDPVWQISLQMLQLSCYSFLAPRLKGSHSSPLFVSYWWGIWMGLWRFGYKPQPWMWGWTSEAEV